MTGAGTVGRPPSRLEVAANTVALATLVGIAIHLAVRIPDMATWELADFRTFWSSGQESFYGGSPARPNRNNPHTTLLLYGPFWRLPLENAWIAFSAFNVAAMLVGVAFVVRAVGGSAWAVLPVFLVVVLWIHGWMSLAQGQVTGPLLCAWGATWWALERGRTRVASGALGLALAAKVFFALPVVCLWLAGKRRVALGAVALAAAIYATGALVAPELYAEHARMLAEVRLGPGDGPNHSLIGTGTRFGWPLVWLVPVVAAVVLWGSRSARPEIAIGLASVGMLLLSPLGWFYYMPLALPALLVSWHNGRPWLGLAAWVVAGSPYFGMATLGLLMLLGTLLIVRTKTGPRSNHPPAP